jgi:hypothetical protein
MPDQITENRLYVLSENDLNRILHHVRHRPDPSTTAPRLSDDQQKAVDVFNIVAAGMAVPVTDGVPMRAPSLRNKDGNVLLVEVPPTATRAVVFSTAGVRTLESRDSIGNAGGLSIPGDLHKARIARVEFYDAHGTLLAISGGEPLATNASQPKP